jgi:hypothetical protein
MKLIGKMFTTHWNMLCWKYTYIDKQRNRHDFYLLDGTVFK